MQQIARSIAQAYSNLPRPHRVMLGSLSVVTLAVAIWQPFVSHPRLVEGEVAKSVQLETQSLTALSPEASEPLDQPAPEDDVPKDEIDDGSDAGNSHDYVVSSGDTLGSILTQYGVDMSTVSALAKQYPALRNLNVGQTLTWEINDDGALQKLTWDVSRRETRVYQLSDGSYKETVENQQGEWKNRVITGTLNGSFVASAQAAGLNRNEINTVIKALQWQMDFRKLQKGDRFSVLLSREMLDGKSAQSQILGVRLRSGDKDYYAIRGEDGKYYDRQGGGLAKGFMRYPTSKHFRISSNFNPHRLNPVTGRVAPHKGVDFAMPVGTPVLAVGDGEVVIAKRSGAAGNYVVIRHGRQYTTRFMHLKTILVKPGQKVKRGDRVALSGNTGRSTGPHLHYEFWVNNQAVNPLTVKLPRSDALTGKERTAFLAQAREVVPQLQLD
ncbi:murein DD-endopeptidase MepM [Edwardsiella tarda]|uniref:Murein DD-endopeptidase MepM n=3 Tax=Edwardsiella tarda TaxID=636 RepID=A0A2A7U452_EDWTA|nr:murein DD-endopeptidase MepM [Edwardsiella tarda]AKH89388.1 murein DD-endopeptidase MepM [Edwardsiella tarda]ATI63022.1 murein DD-endopeptidase MepM [Edwardsiella tarda]PEH73013.1 murein DD-endopeptidase MepM [Edwardsiella tarda]UAL54935.1 murein DD-endopeptidase MepM [Edwardsiella tarda]UCP99006.1 murein DD-endopeptidase MepM [Edwardsiella tarda ATCC 15947 = NBRC 105688]